MPHIIPGGVTSATQGRRLQQGGRSTVCAFCSQVAQGIPCFRVAQVLRTIFKLPAPSLLLGLGVFRFYSAKPAVMDHGFHKPEVGDVVQRIRLQDRYITSEAADVNSDRIV